MEVYINKKDWDKIINYARCASDKWGTEIGGMAVTIQDKDGDWQIKDPQVIKQEVSAALCELDKTELAQYYSRMEIKYKKHNMRFCWWHSHAKMSAFWSGTDTNTIDEYEEGDLSFALVVNVKEEYKCRVSVWKPFTMHEDVELSIISKTDGKYKIPRKIETEVVEACNIPTTKYTRVNSPYQRTFWGGGAEDEKNRVVSEAWIQLIDKVDDLNSKFICGEIQYDKYAKQIKELNELCKKNSIPLSVDLVSQGNFESLLSANAWDLIECDNGYEHLDPTEAYSDLSSWNQSFGIGGLNGKI